jgi:hypothetical protein
MALFQKKQPEPPPAPVKPGADILRGNVRSANRSTVSLGILAREMSLHPDTLIKFMQGGELPADKLQALAKYFLAALGI